jgi:hypothetical protein
MSLRMRSNGYSTRRIPPSFAVSKRLFGCPNSKRNESTLSLFAAERVGATDETPIFTDEELCRVRRVAQLGRQAGPAGGMGVIARAPVSPESDAGLIESGANESTVLVASAGSRRFNEMDAAGCRITRRANASSRPRLEEQTRATRGKGVRQAKYD